MVRSPVPLPDPQEPVEAGVGYWMDAAIFAAAGIPTVNIGRTAPALRKR